LNEIIEPGNPLMSSEKSAVQVISVNVWSVVNVGRALELH
jgi:hypothetical protein